jgi:uncharacterized PurR-regulated membrane protein YhhQ (DUF165 family)
MLWPVVFVMTDVSNEHFGLRGVRLISWLGLAFILYAFLFAFLAVGTVNYACKMTMAIALIPLLYLGRRLIRAYLVRPAVRVA